EDPDGDPDTGEDDPVHEVRAEDRDVIAQREPHRSDRALVDGAPGKLIVERRARRRRGDQVVHLARRRDGATVDADDLALVDTLVLLQARPMRQADGRYDAI